MELWSEIRRKVLVEGVSKREICRDYKMGWRTLEKVLEHVEPPGYRSGVRRAQPKLGAFIGVIDEMLVADRSAPPKQRHTARRIFHRLRDEHGYGGSEVQVRRDVAQTKGHAREVFVPLSHRMGEAQFDFGEATVVIAGECCKAAFAVMTLPFSDAWHLSGRSWTATRRQRQPRMVAPWWSRFGQDRALCHEVGLVVGCVASTGGGYAGIVWLTERTMTCRRDTMG